MATEAAMEAETFEVMLLATIPGGGIRHGQWYTDSAHDSPEAAQWRFREVTSELADPRLVVVVVASRFDAAAGRFRERILAARSDGPAPALDASRGLPAGAWPALRRAFARAPRPVPELRRRPRRPVRPPRRRLLPGLALLGAAGLGAALLLL
jgi:hypothetical protein